MPPSASTSDRDAVVRPTVWNSLPDFIRYPTISADCSRRLLKTPLFPHGVTVVSTIFCKIAFTYTHHFQTHSNPTLTLNGKQIPVVEETKFLGLVFDRKLTFVPHLRYLRTKCLKALNLLRVVAHTSWGGDQQTLLHLYRSLIRSKLDYGCIVYCSTRNSYLKMLEPIQNHALRLCLGAFRTYPASSLCAEANEPPL